MCGRFGLLHTWDEIYAAYALTLAPLNLQPRFNIAPTQPVFAITASNEGGGGEAGGNTANHFQWGLVPSWAKDPAIGVKMINARAETVAEKPAFRAAFRRRRCLIPASGFYEWQKQGTGPKQPFWIAAADGGLLSFAGLWETWLSPDGGELQTCTIITTDANDSLQPIHHRMPVILAPDDFAAWLDVRDETDTGAASALLRPAPDDATTARPVSTRVNNVRNDDASLIEPVEADATEAETPPAVAPPPQGDLFS
jgi:putative SOS response-associated peptidase YedK